MFQPEDLTILFPGEPIELKLGPYTKWSQFYLYLESYIHVRPDGYWMMAAKVYPYNNLIELYHNQPKLRPC